MKRKIFIGSSSEGYSIAEKIKKIINDKLGDWIECETWKDGCVFTINRSNFDSLLKAARKYDYGILVATKDDILFKRLKFFNVMRENVLFEMGLFLGSLGLKRAFLVAHEKIALPSDYNGISVIKINNKNIEQKTNELIKEIEKTKNSFCLKPLPSAALALGYFNSLIIPKVKLLSKKNDDFSIHVLVPSNLNDIDNQITLYETQNPSNSSNNGNRPTVYQYKNDLKSYWDIPTTLKTINTLLDYFLPIYEIGIDEERIEWMLYETRNFIGTLEVLVSNNSLCKGKVFVSSI